MTTTRLAPDLVRVTAPNASAYTDKGTNGYVLGSAAVMVIDPGPDDPAHLHALLAAIAGREVLGIVVTHAHLDHSGLATDLAAMTGAPVLAFGDATAGIRPAPDGLGGGFGVDRAFRPDRTLADGETIAVDGRRLVAIHTPGHMGNHLCLDRGDIVFSGDHAMGFATTLVSPPEGDMGDYVASLARLAALGPRVLMPGHGALVPDGAARIAALTAHRRLREAQVIEALAFAPASAEAIAGRLYAGAASGLRRAATRTVLAHLIDLERRGRVAAEPPLGERSAFRLA